MLLYVQNEETSAERRIDDDDPTHSLFEVQKLGGKGFSHSQTSSVSRSLSVLRVIYRARQNVQGSGGRRHIILEGTPHIVDVSERWNAEHLSIFGCTQG